LIYIKDQLGNEIGFAESPKRIISLVPSLTEALVDLGFEDLIVGITKFCVHPTYLRKKKSIIGGTKNPKIQQIIDLKPDIVFANKEENRQEDIDQLSQETHVYVTDIKSVQDVIEWMNSLQVLFDEVNIAIDPWIVKLKTIECYQANPKDKKVIYMIWKDPYMCAGTDTFIHHMLIKYGFANAIKEERYPIFTEDDLITINPDCIFLSSEPYPFDQKHISLFKQLLPNASIQGVDGEMFSWYGTRIIKADEYIRRLT
jgi:ABC-type Fe3+-hydroxamate transport system substrate-binding protein